MSNDGKIKTLLVGAIIAVIPVLLSSIANNFFENERALISAEIRRNEILDERLFSEKYKLYSEYLLEAHTNIARGDATFRLMYMTFSLRLIASNDVISSTHSLMLDLKGNNENKDAEYYTRIMSTMNDITSAMRKDIGLPLEELTKFNLEILGGTPQNP